MLAVVVLVLSIGVVFGFAEAGYRLVRLWRRPPRWRALALLLAALGGLWGVVWVILALL